MSLNHLTSANKEELVKYTSLLERFVYFAFKSKVNLQTLVQLYADNGDLSFKIQALENAENCILANSFTYRSDAKDELEKLRSNFKKQN